MKRRFLIRTSTSELACLVMLAAFCGTASANELAATQLQLKDGAAAQGEIPHPVSKVIEIAESAYDYLDRKVVDYSGAIVTRQRVSGRLTDHQKMVFKIRHRQDAQPFSMYVKFIEPERVEGREMMFVEGQFENRMIVRRGGVRLASLTTAVDPSSTLASTEGDLPVTEVGLKELLSRFIQVAEGELGKSNVQVRYFNDARVNNRSCVHIRLLHPIKDDGAAFHWADIYIDRKLKMPVRFAVYDWPSSEGASPGLLEEVTFINVKVNTGLSDADFDVKNDRYNFGGMFAR